MTPLSVWLNEYHASHRHPINQRIHKFCVPSIVFSILGLAWSIPAPINLAYGVTLLGLVYYTCLSWRVALAMAVTCGVMLLILTGLAALDVNLFWLSAVISDFLH